MPKVLNLKLLKEGQTITQYLFQKKRKVGTCPTMLQVACLVLVLYIIIDTQGQKVWT